MAASQSNTSETVDIDPLDSPLRLLAMAAGTLLIASFLSVFLHLTDVAGGSVWLGLTVGAALVMATVLARRLPVNQGILPGLAILAIGPVGYLVLVPELHQDVASPAFVVNLGTYLTGVSVLGFLSVDIWAVAVAPGPTFLTWYLLLRRRYDLAGGVGGLTLAFFALTGDAGALTTLAGMTGLLGVLGIGTLDREGGNWDQLEQLGLIVAVSVFLARALSIVPDGGRAARPSASGPSRSVPIAGDLTDVSAEAEIFERISLSPTVYFTIEADHPDYWRVAAFDRYTGSDWIRTGEASPFGAGADSPPGPVRRNHQSVTVNTPVSTMPAAWKPVRVLRGPTRPLQTALGGLDPDRTLTTEETYTVLSETPRRSPGALRAAGWPDEAGRERFRQLPGSTADRVVQLAERLAGDANTAYDAALAIERWLEGTKGYSLTVDPPSGDLVDGFLFGMDRGYCVYFASAMAVLLRALGIPSRFVLGYSTGQQVEDTRWVVRGLDSHAWVEIRFDGIGWVPFDPTPAGPRAAAEADHLDQARRTGRTDVDIAGSLPTRTPTATTVPASGDQSSPTAAGGEAILPGGGQGTVTGTLPTPGRTGTESGGRPAGVTRLVDDIAGRDKLTVLAGTASLVLGLHWFRVAERGGNALSLYRQRPTGEPRVDIARAYDRMERVLSSRYRDRREDETPRQFIDVLAHGGLDDRAHRLVRLYERARYSSEITHREADEAIELADAMVREEGRLAGSLRELI